MNNYQFSNREFLISQVLLGIMLGSSIFFGILARSPTIAIGTASALGGLGLYSLLLALLFIRLLRPGMLKKASITVDLSKQNALLLFISPIIIAAFMCLAWLQVQQEASGASYESIIQVWPYLDDNTRLQVSQALKDGSLSQWEWLDLQPKLTNSAGFLSWRLDDVDRATQRTHLLELVRNSR